MDILTYGLLNKKVEEAKNVSDEKITASVNTYLNENPPVTGATAEQAAQIDKNVADIGELKGDLVNITSEENFNILDEIFETGSINSQNGENVPSNTRIRTKNFISIKPKTQYWFNTSGYGIYVYFYDESYNFLRALLGTDNNGIKDECVTTDADVRFFRFRTNDDYGTIYKNDFCVSKSDSYTPYIPHRIANDIVARNGIDYLNEDISEIRKDMKKVSNPLHFMRFCNVNGIQNGGQAIQDNVITRDGYQFCCYVNSNNKPEIAKRTIGSDEWEFNEISAYPASITLDGHYYLSMGMDEDGQIHIIGGSHGTVMRYVRTAEPYDINSFFQVSPMIGDSEDAITYPCFINDNLGRLYLFYRYTIIQQSGITMRYVLNCFVVTPTSHKWVRISPNIITGTVTEGSNGGYPYINHIVVDKLGRIHISGCWRGGCNYDIFYLMNDNRGNAQYWKKSNGESYTLPITRDTAEVVVSISNPNNGLLNQNGMCTDENNNPHIVYFKIDDSDKTNIFHAYFDGKSWHDEKVTNFDYRIAPNLTSYEGQLSRPSIFCYNGRIYLIYRHNFDGLGGKLRIRDITDYPSYKEAVIFDGELGAYEASYDSNAIRNGELNMLICHTRTDIYEALPNEQWHNEENWIKYPMSGVMCIDLNYIDEVLNNKCRVPRISRITSGKSIFVKGGSKQYIKLVMARNTNAQAKVTAKMFVNNEETIIGSVYLYDTDSEIVRESNYLMVNNEDDAIVKVVNDTNNIEFSYIELAELCY